MIISHKYKFIFIHITKTGGVSIEKILKVKETPHAHAFATEIKKDVGEHIWDDYFKFSFVRNPWDKMVSQYFYIQQRVLYNVDFKDFIKDFFRCNIIDHHPKMPRWKLPMKYQPLQLPWLTDDTGDIIVDFIGKFENLQEDFNTICDKIGIPRQELPHKNKSKHKHYTEYYDDETREIVAEKYAKDIEHFGYEFGK